MRIIQGLIFFLLLASCESKYQSVALTFVRDSKLGSIRTLYAPIYVRTHEMTRVETTGLSMYQLGRLGSQSLGETEADIVSRIILSSANPIFGSYSQAIEDEATTDESIYTIEEQETVTKVELHIPFFSHQKREDDGSLTKDGDKNVYELDSIYGNSSASFMIKVDRLNYYLGDFDVKTLTNKKGYYSDADYSGFKGEVLYDGAYRIDDSEYVIYKEDDPDTDEDESEDVSIRLEPRIILDLNKDFFQTNILDKEGSGELLNHQAFLDYMRGIYISSYGHSEDLMMLLDYYNAYIEISYTYKKVDDKGTANDTSDDVIEDKEGKYKLNLSSKAFNVLHRHAGPHPDANEVNAERIYQKGPFFLMEIRLFDDTGTQEQDKIKENDILVNDASLTFYIDRASTDLGKANKDPFRLYIFNLDDGGRPIGDYYLDVPSRKSYVSRLVHSELIDDDKLYYKINITEHLNNIMNNDMVNPRLGVMVISDINDIYVNEAYDTDGNEYEIPKSSITTPLGAVFYGASSKVDESKRLRLEIQYTQKEN